MEQATCGFCGSAASVPFLTLRDVVLKLPDEYPLVRCADCGLLYLCPRPTAAELVAHYPDDYAPFVKAIDDQPSRVTRWAQRYGMVRRCRAIARRQAGGRLLDIGCATGVFLSEARRLGGWDVAGVEPAATAAEYAIRRFGLPVFQGTLLEAAYPEASFDVVTLWDVLEHVDAPGQQLAEIHRILRPGGWLVLKLPDPDSWEARRFGCHWLGYDAPRHLSAFPRTVLVRRLIALGFDRVETSLLGNDFSTLLGSLALALAAGGRPAAGRAVRRLAGSSAARAGLAPAVGLLRRLGGTSSLVYFARKGQAGRQPK